MSFFEKIYLQGGLLVLNAKKFISVFMACTIACFVVYSAGAGFIPAAVAAVTVDKPVPSIPGGRYEQSINVELTTTTPGADIYYTLDGTLPDETSLKYNGTPIVLTASANVSVIAMKDDDWSTAGTYGYIIKTTEKPLLKFAAMGDVHMAPGTAEDDANNRARWVSNFDVLGSVLPNPDAIVFAGDMINDNNFNTGQHHSFVYDILKTQMERKGWSGMQMQIAIGNHDARVSDVQKGYPADWFTSQSNGYYEKIIKGYSFLFVNANNYNGDTTQRNWLKGRLAAITADPANRNKPIFLTLHHPVAGTVMDGQQASNENLNTDLKDFPQVVVLSGHSHLNINDERSIFQKDFTVINVGSMSYLETEYGYSMVTKEGELNETALFSGTQSPVIEVYQDRIEIERIEYQWGKGSNVPAFNSAGALAGKKWVVKLKGNTNEEIKSNFTYKPQNRNKVAPVFPTNLDMKVEKRADNVPVLSFKQAKDDDSMHHYEATVYDYRTAQVEKTYNVLSDFYFTPIPNNMNIPMKDLNPAKSYLISVKATDATGNSSAPVQILYASQVAPPAPTPIDPTTMWNQLVSDMKFEDNLNEDAAGASGLASQVGTVSYVTGKSGQAVSIASGNANYVDLGDRSDLKFGNGDFTVSFWHKGDLAGDQTVLSNKNWNSGGNLGWYIGPAISNNMTLNLANGVGNRVDTTAASVGKDWHYFTISVNRASHTASTYVDGIKQATGDISTLGTSSLDTNFHIILGADGNKSNGGATVTLDDLKIWKRALSATEAKALSDSYQSANLYNFSQLTSKIQEAEQFAAHVAGITGASLPAQVQTELTAKLAAAKAVISGSEAAVIDQVYIDLMWALQTAQAKLNYTFITKKNFSIDSFSSYADNEGAFASNILDDSLSSIWHSKWQSPVPDFPHWVIIDMKSTHSINGINRKSRLSQGDMGFPKTFELYASDNLADLKNSAYLANPANKVTGTFGTTWTGNVYSDYASLGKTLNGRYVKFVVTSTYNTNGAKFTSMSEIDFTGTKFNATFDQLTATIQEAENFIAHLAGAPGLSIPVQMKSELMTKLAAARAIASGSEAAVIDQAYMDLNSALKAAQNNIVYTFMPKTDFSIDSFSSVDLGNNNASNILDGSEASIWHSRWETPAAPFPHWVIIDMKKTNKINGIQRKSRTRQADLGFPKTFELYASDNLNDLKDTAFLGNTANKVTGTFGQTWTGTVYKDYLSLDKPVQGRYVKFVVTSTYNTDTSLTFTSMSEIDFTGEKITENDASLKDLKVGGVSLSGFAPDKFDYALPVPYETTVTTVTYMAASPSATVVVSGGENLVVGSNPVTVTVAAQDGTMKVYRIAVTRQAQALSSDASLLDLRVNGTTLNGFAPDKLDYALLVPYETTVSTVTYTEASPFATVVVNGGENMVVGSNPMTVTVAAQDGTMKVYRIAVTRQAQALSSDASLLDLRVNGTTLNGFAPDKLDYALSVPYETTVSTVTYTAASPAATVAVNGGENMVVGSNPVTVTVAAQDGTMKVYRIAVSRQAQALSSDAYLLDLRVNGTTADGFAPDKLDYALSVPYETTVTTVTYMVASPFATVVVSGGENMVVGSNLVTVTVTAQDSTFKRYDITVKRLSNSDPDPGSDPGPDQSGPSTTPNKPELPKDAVVIKNEDMKDGQSTVSVELPEGKNRLIIPVEQAKQLNGRSLQVQDENVKLTVPGELLKSASNLLPAPDDKAEITVSIEAVEAAQAERTLKEASRKEGGIYKLGGQMVDLSIFATDADGKQFALAKLAKPVTMTFPIPAGMDSKLAGIYEIKEDGSLVYLGGKRVSGNTAIEVGIDRLSQYAVLSLEKTYNDVTNQHWAFSTIRELSAQHIVNGAVDATFAPGKDISRAEFAALLTRTLGLSSADTSPFGDVTEKDWYAKEVAAAYKAGIISGNEQRAFEPNRSITREEMAVMLVRAYEHRTGSKLETSSEASSDASEISDWALPFVNSALQAKLLSGRQEGLFVPDEHTTRAEAAQAIYNLLK
ncbi:hypothetical protein GCM10008018_12700 [Paenibacillus marchantiophytorum]|uniref:Metallophosphoesterase n=1 Tax=Paenibacillus marchantiophytorum TaxID=1619310 RepID=A0ABQ2BSY4_9BACL|nr:cadherin-like beta sandwich domain-containing protein [Paenibacillus marchantiophytorum]GGI45545.1 hypothetical protein GCM10008018_12700 [Paenibacillus marchantiophytorum]